MSSFIRITCWLSLIGLLSIQSALADSSPEPKPTPLTIRVSGNWKLVETANFRCWSQLADSDARQLAESCETWRQRLRTTWISRPDRANWTPKCDVYVHPTRAAYNQALNRPGDYSVGTTGMNFDQGRTVYRRIDVRADASDWSNAALPHELTHVVLGERFGGHALPRWADEGIAMLSESAEKHRERLDSLQSIVANQSMLTIAELVRAGQLPAAHRRDAFYGQSLALSSMLVGKSTPARFADFIEESIGIGFDQAIRRHYQMDGLSAVQAEWNTLVKRPDAIRFVSLPIQVGNETKVVSTTQP